MVRACGVAQGEATAGGWRLGKGGGQYLFRASPFCSKWMRYSRESLGPCCDVEWIGLDAGWVGGFAVLASGHTPTHQPKPRRTTAAPAWPFWWVRLRSAAPCTRSTHAEVGCKLQQCGGARNCQPPLEAGQGKAPSHHAESKQQEQPNAPSQRSQSQSARAPWWQRSAPGRARGGSRVPCGAPGARDDVW